jgi:histidine triad (HIT) family protein
MSEDSIFTKIIRGEIPSHKIYEDDKTFAFLDVRPIQSGHVLVVPKIQVDKFYDLPDENYVALWQTVKNIAKHMEKVLGQRILLKIVGTDVPHVHIHLFPADPNMPPNELPVANVDDLAKMAAKLRMY